MLKTTRQLAILFLSCVAVAMSAQPAEDWSAAYGGDGFEESQALATVSTGGFVLVGASSSPVSGRLTQPAFGSNDYLIVRVNADSTIAWERRIGGTDNDVATEILIDSRGQVIVAGRSRSRINGAKTTEVFGFQEIWVVAYDLSGNLLWQQSYGGTGGEEPFGIVEADNGNLFIAARTDSQPHPTTPQRIDSLRGPNSFWLIETTPTGDFVREFLYGGSGSDELWGLKKLRDGSMVLFGSSHSGASLDKTSTSFGSSDMWLVRVNQQGAILNQYAFGGDQPENPFVVTQYSNGDLFVAGQTRSGPSGNKVSPSFGSIDLWCIRFNLNTGAIVWERTYGGDQDDNAYTGEINVNDYIFLAGNTRSENRVVPNDQIEGADDAWIKYISPTGEQIWDYTRGGNGRENIRGLTRSTSGGWYLVGESNSDEFDWKSGPTYGADDVNGIPANDIWYAKLECDFFVDLGVRDTSLCLGEEVTLRNDSSSVILPNTTFLWSDGTLDSVLTIQPTADMQIVLTSVSPDACEASDTVEVSIHPTPQVEAIDIVDASCGDVSSGSIFFEASTDALNFDLDGVEYTAPQLFNNLAGGDYLFRVNSSLDRCGVDTLVTVGSEGTFSIDLGPDREVIIGDEVSLNIVSSTTDSLTYEWSGVPGICSDCASQRFRLMQSTTVVVQATNSEGCTQEARVEIKGIEDKRVGIPNAISPNNDGVNDRFAVFATPFVERMGPMRIFDRWGNLVYTGIGDQLSITDGWDGTYRGKPVMTGTFTYILPVTFIDGERRVYQGELTVIR